MQLFNSILLLSALFAPAFAVAQGVGDSPDAILALKMRDMQGLESRSEPAELVDRDLTKRACRNNGCACRSGTRQGQYCGYCYAVTKAGSGSSWDDIFECNPNGGCCSYGSSSKCAGNNWYDWCPK